MSRPLQADEAIDLLIKDPSKYQTPQALRELVRQVRVESPGQVTVLYSGRVADRVSAWNIIKAMQETGEDVRLIDRTEINNFLNSREFTRAAAVAHGVTFDDMRRGDPIAKAANDWLYHPTDGPWADASARFADATRGEVKVIASGAAPDRVFAQTELPRILANPEVTTVEGIPREVLAARQASHGSQAAFEMIVANSHDTVGAIRTAVNAQGVPLRGERGQLQLDNREYFRGTSIEGRTPTFHEVTRLMGDLMGEPNAYARAGRQHLDDIARAGASPMRASMGMGRVPGVAAGGIGVALTAADAAESGQRAASLYDMGNATGAQSELIHFTARNVGAWGGAALGAGVGAAVSSPSGPGAIIGGIVGGAVGLVGGQRLADVLDHRKIYLQKDEQGEVWSFDPEAPARGWRRVETVDTLAPSGRPVEQRQQAVATGELDAQLDRKAATVSLELMLARPPVPRDPYTLPAAPGDASSIPDSPWRRDPGSGQWKRHVYGWQDDGSDLGRQVLRETAVADPARAAQLEARSQAILRENVHLAPAAMAARYELAFHDNGWSRHGALPESAAKALVDDGRLIGSDGAEYRRQQDGRWERSALFGFSSAEADASMRQELDATSALLREGLAAHRDMLAQRPVPEPLTFEASLAKMAASEYASRGITLSPEVAQDMGRALAADYRARELDGPLMLRLQPDPTTRGYGPDSPIGLHTRAADGDMTLRFTMTPAEARAMLDAPDAVRSRNDGAPAAPPSLTETPTPERHSSVPSQRSETPTASAPSIDPREPQDPDHRLYKQIERGVVGIDTERGRSFDAVSERLTLCAFCDAKAANITSADHVAINQRGKLQADGTHVAGGTLLFIVQGQDPSDPAARRSVTDVAQAVQRTVEQSLQNVEILARQQTQSPITAPVQDEPARAMRMA